MPQLGVFVFSRCKIAVSTGALDLIRECECVRHDLQHVHSLGRFPTTVCSVGWSVQKSKSSWLGSLERNIDAAWEKFLLSVGLTLLLRCCLVFDKPQSPVCAWLLLAKSHASLLCCIGVLS